MSADAMSDGITSAEARLLNVRMGALTEDVREVKTTMQGMARSLEQLVRIEEQQKDMRSALGRAFDEVSIERGKRELIESRVSVIERDLSTAAETRRKADDIDNRLSSIERDLPGLRELRRWVVGGVLSGLAMITASLISFLVQHHII